MAESQLPKNMYWNPTNKRWEVGGKNKNRPIFFADESGLGSDVGIRSSQTGSFNAVNANAFVNTARVIVGGGTISLIKKLLGTIPLINVGTNSVAVATITGMGSAGIAVGDTIYPTVRAAGLVAAVIMGQAWVPTTNVVNIALSSPAINTAGSQSPVGIDIVVVRST